MRRSLTPRGHAGCVAAWFTVSLLAGACASPTGTGTSPTAAPSPPPATTTTAATTSTAAPTTTAHTATTAVPTSTAAPVTTTSSVEEATVRLTIVYDNTAYDERLTPAWGFAVLVEAPGGTLLFDTGGDGTILLGNMALLGIAPTGIDTVVLSHGHDDHTGVLRALLEAGAEPTVYLPASLLAQYQESLGDLVSLVGVTGPQEILPGVFSTGEMGEDIIEQALTIRTTAGSVVVTGCAHPGIVEVLQRAQEVLPGEIALVVGGFHLVEVIPHALATIVDSFRELGVQQVAPAHCTGTTATDAFAWEFGDDFARAGVGTVIEIG